LGVLEGGAELWSVFANVRSGVERSGEKIVRSSGGGLGGAPKKNIEAFALLGRSSQDVVRAEFVARAGSIKDSCTASHVRTPVIPPLEHNQNIKTSRIPDTGQPLLAR